MRKMPCRLLIDELISAAEYGGDRARITGLKKQLVDRCCAGPERAARACARARKNRQVMKKGTR